MVRTEFTVHGFRQFHDTISAGGSQISSHAPVEREKRSGSSYFRTHIANGRFAGSRQGSCSRSEIFDDGVRSSFYGQNPSKFQDHIFRGSPAAQFSGQADTDNPWHFQFPFHTRHHVYGIRTADADGHHAQSSGIRSVRVGSYHHPAGESVIFEHYLVNDSGARLPEADAVTRGYIAQKVVNFFVCFGCRSNVLLCSFVRLYQVVTVHGGGNSHFFFSCIHELKQCHLGSRVLHSDAVGTEIYVVFTPLVVFQIALIEQMGIQNLLG